MYSSLLLYNAYSKGIRLGFSLAEIYNQPTMLCLLELACVGHSSPRIAVSAINCIAEFFTFPSPQEVWLSHKSNADYANSLRDTLIFASNAMLRIAHAYG